MGSEVAAKADFTGIRYAQCWEDADVLLAGLDVKPGDTCLSIASAGDNALALLARSWGGSSCTVAGSAALIGSDVFLRPSATHDLVVDRLETYGRDRSGPGGR